MPDQPKVTLTLITALKPPVLSKAFTLGGDGTLQKHPGGNLMVGSAQTLQVSLHQFCAGLKALRPNQAFVYGTSGHKEARVVAQAKLTRTKAKTSFPIIARDREHFVWPEGPAMLMIDYDPAPGGLPMGREERLDRMYGVWPGLKSAPHIWAASASICIHRSDTGEELRSVCGQRIYVPVLDAKDIPRAGATLFARLWLDGHGRYDVSKSGALLERSIIDTAVWQPERLDFAGGASCGYGLEQRRPEPIVFNADAPFIDSRESLPHLTGEEKRTVQELKIESQKAKRPEVVRRQAEWVDDRIKKGIENVPVERHDAEKKRLGDLYRRAVAEKRLFGDFVLHSAKDGAVTVAEILNNPDKFHEDRFRDPLEPEYCNDPRIAYANLKDSKHPYIFSHAHGGQRYSLHRVIEVIQIEGGDLHLIVERILALMRQDNVVYDRGELIRISSGQMYPVTPGWLSVYLNAMARFEKRDGRKKCLVPVDCPDGLSKKITELAGVWGLPRLNGLITAPTITPAGRIIEKNGYDSETGLYLEFPDGANWTPIQTRPSNDDVKNAVERFWLPFREFPFETPTDAGVHLATLLAAPVRQMLPQAPATYYGAPVAGTGKTLLANCASLLAGQEPTVYPPTESEEEMRKRLSLVTRAGLRAVIIDNVVGTLRSASLCTFLTSPNFSDRVLGESTNMRLPQRIFCCC